jgi:hypothetical protein
MKLFSSLLSIGFALIAATGCKTNSFTAETEKAEALPPIEQRSFTQVSFPERSTVVTQGRKGASSKEGYSVTARGILDLLIVVDNSQSMMEEQANLASRMTPLLSAVKDSDWRIGVVTTDPSDGCLESVIKKGEIFPELRFRAAINNGINGTGIERPIYQAVEALKPGCRLLLGKWLRPNSTLAVLFLTDEDNCFGTVNTGYSCPTAADREASYLTKYISSIRKLGTEARLYGVFWHPSQATCNGAYKQATILAEAVQASGGTWGSICQNDFTPTLTKISSDVAKILTADFALKSTPDSGSVKLTVNGSPWTDFKVDGVNVHFTKTPPANAAISVTYVSGASGLVTNEFDLPSEPVDGSLSAKVGTASAGSVTWDSSKKKAVLSTTPADGATVEIKYREVSPLKETFEIATAANPSTVKVKVNGAALDASQFKYDSITGIVKITPAPPESAKIDIEWRGSKRAG